MSAKSFDNELERALARPDAKQLQQVVAVYHDWNARSGTEKDWLDELDVWFDADKDFDRGLALVIIAAAKYDDPKFLAVVAAGLLENLLQRTNRPTEESFERVLEEARKTARFRWMLSGVHRQGMMSDQAAGVKKLVGALTCDDPLPPGPWA